MMTKLLDLWARVKEAISSMKDNWKVYYQKLVKFLFMEQTVLVIISTFIFLRTGNVAMAILMLCALTTAFCIIRYLKHRLMLEQMDRIDLNFFNFKKEEELDPIDAMIDDCFSRYLILYRGFKEGQYITEKQEKDILSGVVTEISKQLSEPMVEKLKLYYGPAVMDTIATKAFIRVSLYCANTKKVLYQEPGNKKEIEQLLKDAMILNSLPSE